MLALIILYPDSADLQSVSLMTNLSQFLWARITNPRDRKGKWYAQINGTKPTETVKALVISTVMCLCTSWVKIQMSFIRKQ